MKITIIGTGYVGLVTGACLAELGNDVFCLDVDQNKVGPSLLGIIGRKAGTHAGFKYSAAMSDAGINGVVWDEAALTTYLHDPKAFVKGTKMAFVGLKADKDVADVIAYLKQFSQ